VKFLIQENILKREPHYEQLLKALDFFQTDYTLCNLFEFVDVIFPNHVTSLQIETAEELCLSSSVPTYIFGSHKFSRLIKERGISPGAFDSQNFDFDHWSKGFGLDNILNGDSFVSLAGELPDLDYDVFIRPFKDDKIFTGMTMIKEYYADWKRHLTHFKPEDGFDPKSLNAYTPVTVSSVKDIYSEHRFFVVDGKVVTGSTYKLGDTVKYDSIIDQKIVDFAQSMADRWQPADAFVIDIADTPNGLRVVEINTFGVSGFYYSDMFKVVDALIQYETKINATR